MRKKNTERGEMTAQKIQIPPVSNTPLLPPEFVRLPRPKTRCAITGLSRSSLDDLVAAEKIHVVKLRKRGAARGITLISVAEKDDYLADVLVDLGFGSLKWQSEPGSGDATA
jgi:hypothetical protein